MKTLYCILVPHGKSDRLPKFLDYVMDNSRPEAGYTQMPVCEGGWYNPITATVEKEKMIPIMVACNSHQIDAIALFAKSHFEEILILYWEVSNNVRFV